MDTTITPLTCGECGTGNYAPSVEIYGVCNNCGHTVHIESDVFPYLDDEETIIVRDGLVCVVGE